MTINAVIFDANDTHINMDHVVIVPLAMTVSKGFFAYSTDTLRLEVLSLSPCSPT